MPSPGPAASNGLRARSPARRSRAGLPGGAAGLAHRYQHCRGRRGSVAGLSAAVSGASTCARISRRGAGAVLPRTERRRARGGARPRSAPERAWQPRTTCCRSEIASRGAGGVAPPAAQRKRTRLKRVVATRPWSYLAPPSPPHGCPGGKSRGLGREGGVSSHSSALAAPALERQARGAGLAVRAAVRAGTVRGRPRARNSERGRVGWVHRVLRGEPGLAAAEGVALSRPNRHHCLKPRRNGRCHALRRGSGEHAQRCRGRRLETSVERVRAGATGVRLLVRLASARLAKSQVRSPQRATGPPMPPASPLLTGTLIATAPCSEPGYRSGDMGTNISHRRREPGSGGSRKRASARGTQSHCSGKPAKHSG